MKKVVAALGTTVCVAALFVGLVATLARSPYVAGLPFLRATTPMVVLSGSMEPHLPVGALVFVRSVDAGSIGVGDVITFEAPNGPDGSAGRVTTHRVVGVEGAPPSIRFRTQGDANRTPDPWTVSGDAVIGTVSYSVPYVGYLSAFVRSRLGFLLLILIPALALIAAEVVSVVREIMRGRGAEVTP